MKMPAVIENEEKQAREWDALYRRIIFELQQLGAEGDALGRKDYWLLDDNYGVYAQQLLYINNLDLLTTPMVKSLQSILSDYPHWEIVVAVDVPRAGECWPKMGLKIRAHEIIDGLQRRYFPPEYRNLTFDGSRPGTERD